MFFLRTHRKRRVFISWVRYTTRSMSFARALGAEPYFFHKGQDFGYCRHFIHALQTIVVLLRRRPGLVFCMNPPYFAPLVAYLYCLIFDARFAIDSHTAAFEEKWMRLKPLHRFLVKRAIFSTVTNEELARRAREMGGKSLIATDIPFTMPDGSYPVSKNHFTVCFVCGYASDEPVLEVLEAARQLPDVRFYVTGDTKHATEQMHQARPDNVTFTGYLSNEQYAGLLRSVSAILVLTKRKFTMQRGGSEAITVGKPLITSNSPILRRVFSKGTIHVDNTAGSIKSAIETMRADLERYQSEIGELAGERQGQWEPLRDELERLISEAQKRRKSRNSAN